MSVDQKRLVREAWEQSFRGRDTRPIYEWAADSVTLPAAFTKTGKFSILESRYLIEPFQALQSEEVREVNICGPRRDGKTMVPDIWLPWIIENDPGPFLGIFDKDDQAKEHCELRTWPILEGVASIKARLEAIERHEARTQEILFPEMPVYIWGPAIGNLQSKGFRYVWLDEPWLYAKGRIGEAQSALGDFAKMGIEKFLCTSQGGWKQDRSKKETADWWEQFESGELNERVVPCLRCGFFQKLVWWKKAGSPPLTPALSPLRGEGEAAAASTHAGRAAIEGRRETRAPVKEFGLVWDPYKDGRGNLIEDKCAATLRYVCEACGHAHLVKDQLAIRAVWNDRGRYQVFGEAKRIKKSYRWSGILTYPWEYLFSLWCKATKAASQGDRTLRVQFKQKRLAEFHDQLNDDDEFERLPEVEVLTAVDGAEIEVLDPATGRQVRFIRRLGALDVQRNHFWFLCDAWNEQGDDVTLWFEKLLTWHEVEERVAQWKIAPEDFCVDVNYHERAQEVIEQCARHGYELTDAKGNVKWVSWKAFRGTDRTEFKYAPSRGSQKGQTLVLPYDPSFERGDPCAGLPSNDPRRGELMGKLCQIYKWSNPWVKDVVAARRDGLASGIQTLVAPGDWVAEFSRQLHGERKLPRTVRGHTVYEWHRVHDNHGLDCKCMTTVRAWQRGYVGTGNGERRTEKGEH